MKTTKKTNSEQNKNIKKPASKIEKKNSVLLVPHITPTRYNLTLKPDMDNFVFEGSETIDIVLDKDVKTITLHSKDIAISTAEIKIGKEIQFADKIEYDTAAETATFTFKKSIKKGKAKLNIVFSGIISENLRGFYKSRYEIDGVTKHIATTQFEATDARRAFPCFDEPAQKAIFDVHLVIPGDHIAISNTLPIRVAEHEAGFKTVSFAPTPKMSTYLLAFIIGHFEYLEGQTGGPNPTLVRVYTTPGKKHQAKFALEVALKSLNFYNEYFKIPYPLDTLDMIAIPDFESGAMENWGAVTYRETAILVDEEHSSLSSKQWVALVVAHELAHQWFGNLVTMQWWTDLWLNEGFASYIEYLAVDHIFPEWKIWDQFLTSDTAVALKLDALSNSHPIEVKVNHPSEISEIFDAVSYSKGAAVIKMLAEYIGHDAFRLGLQHYLKKHSYKNTNTVDLWEAFEKTSKKNVKEIMKNWTSKTGYPLLTLSKEKSGYFISQERFFSSRISAEENKEKTIWQVPVSYESNQEVLKMLITKPKSPLIGSAIGKINKGELTLSRVRYDKETLERIASDISENKIPTHDRLGVIRDLFALAEGGYIPTTEALDFALHYKDEKEYIVWAEISGGINRIRNIHINEKTIESFSKYALSIFSPLAKHLGWEKNEGEPHSNVFLRNLALLNAGLYGDKTIIKQAHAIFKSGSIPADLRSVVYSIITLNGSKKEWVNFENLYKKEKMHEEKNRYGNALTMFKDKGLLLKTLEFSLSQNVRNQDAPQIVTSVWSNSQGKDIAWSFVKDNWSTLLSRYGEGGHSLSRLLSAIGTHTNTKDLKDIQKFFTKNKAPGAERTIEQGIEKINSNIAWIKDEQKNITKWLTKKYK
jgi:puromycin-sensitive aminopeptidase